MSTKKFTIEVPDWTKVSLDNAKFILQEGKDYVKYLSEQSDKITNRAFAILAILIPITSALIVFFVKENYNPSLPDKFLTRLLLAVVVSLIFIMFGLGQIVFPRMFMPLGKEPKDLCSKEFLGIDLEAGLATLALVMGEIEAAQVKIDYNEKQNASRTLYLKRIMIAIVILFALTTAITLGYVFEP